MSQQLLRGRQIKIETSVRCDWDGVVIQKGKYGLQVVGDPEEVKCQGIFHGRNCYDNALAHYNEKKKEVEEGNE